VHVSYEFQLKHRKIIILLFRDRPSFKTWFLSIAEDDGDCEKNCIINKLDSSFDPEEFEIQVRFRDFLV